ncbi:Ornithine cyclodeaminase-like protein 2 [Elsinoe fawcettii]|nr:Ornithine cyclodeaminase-like protein 2 [Elsinoe fawcettii]
MDSTDSLIILGEKVIHDLLLNLERPDILYIHDELVSCLVKLTVEDERKYQPDASIVNRPEGQKILFRPFTSSNAMGTKIIATPRPVHTSEGVKNPPLDGVITICNDDGKPRGLLDGKEITGYRTTLSAMVPFLWRRNVANIVIFGAGMQAQWHCRLALALRGSEIRSITVVNRTASRAEEVVSQLRKENESIWKSQVKLEWLDPAQSEYDNLLRRLLEDASVIFCTTPSTSPLFPASVIIDHLEKDQGRIAPLITAVGSWQADMLEIDPSLIHHAIRVSDSIDFSRRDSPSRHTTKGGAIVTDDREASLKHAGEVVQTGLKELQLVEIGDLMDRKRRDTLSAELEGWMASGLLIYKSIGVSMTDLVTSNFILDFARRRSLGTKVTDF